jgi:hypothetical protein
MGILVSISPAVAHDWYKGLTSRNGLSCCNDRDCQRVGHRYTPGNGHEVEIEGQWTSVDPHVILPISSPDGQTHACFERSWSSLFGSQSSIRFILRCVILGGES